MSKQKSIFIIFLAVLLLLCGGSEKKFILYAQANTIDSTFTITWLGESNKEGTPIELTSFGCYIDYDSSLIEYKYCESFGLFSIEKIGIKKNLNGNEIPGTLILAFSEINSDSKVSMNADSIFSITFEVKKGVVDNQLIELTVYNNNAELQGDGVEMKAENVVLEYIKKLVFLLNWKLK